MSIIVLVSLSIVVPFAILFVLALDARSKYLI